MHAEKLEESWPAVFFSSGHVHCTLTKSQLPTGVDGATLCTSRRIRCVDETAFSGLRIESKRGNVLLRHRTQCRGKHLLLHNPRYEAYFSGFAILYVMFAIAAIEEQRDNWQNGDARDRNARRAIGAKRACHDRHLPLAYSRKVCLSINKGAMKRDWGVRLPGNDAIPPARPDHGVELLYESQEHDGSRRNARELTSAQPEASERRRIGTFHYKILRNLYFIEYIAVGIPRATF